MSSNFNRGYTIRSNNHDDATNPHAACPQCYADCTTSDTTTIIEYRCPRGHTFTGLLRDGLGHSAFLNRYHAGQEQNR